MPYMNVSPQKNMNATDTQLFGISGTDADNKYTSTHSMWQYTENIFAGEMSWSKEK